MEAVLNAVDFGQLWHPWLRLSALAEPVPKVSFWDELAGIHLCQQVPCKYHTWPPTSAETSWEHHKDEPAPGPWQGGGGSYLVFLELGSTDASCWGKQGIIQLRLKPGTLWTEQS